MIQYRVNGRLIRESAKTRDKKKANHLLVQRMAEAQKGKHTFPNRETLVAFLGAYLEDQREVVDGGTWTRYEFCKKNLQRDDSPLAGIKLAKVTVGLLSEYLTYRLNKGASKATALKEVNWLKGALAEARRQHFIPIELLVDVRDEISPKRLPALRRANRPRDRYLAPHEIEAIRQAIPRDNDNLRDAFELALFTGLRQENILELTEGQITLDCDPPVIRYSPEQMKSDRWHTVELSPQAKEVIWRRHSMNPDTPDRHLFRDFRPAWKRMKRKLGLPHFTFHDLKKTYGTYRIAAGVPITNVQGELAHTDPRLTLRVYTQATTPDVRAWASVHFAWDLGSPPPVQESVQDSVRTRQEDS